MVVKMPTLQTVEKIIVGIRLALVVCIQCYVGIIKWGVSQLQLKNSPETFWRNLRSMASRLRIGWYAVILTVTFSYCTHLLGGMSTSCDHKMFMRTVSFKSNINQSNVKVRLIMV